MDGPEARLPGADAAVILRFTHEIKIVKVIAEPCD